MSQGPFSILAVGSMAFDSISTPSGKVDQVLGGSANYFSIAASFYAPVKIIGVVGEDFPKSHIEWLSSRKIDISGVKTATGKTFHWVGAYDQNLNEAKTLSTALNVFEHFSPELSPAHQKSDYVFLANIDPVLQLKVLEQVQNPKLIACDSMNFWITGKPQELKQVLKKTDILSINEGEAALLTGESHIVRAATRIREMGPRVLIIKRGEYGAMLLTDAGFFLAPAFPVDKVVDPTGAGDTFAGAFMGYLAEAQATREMATHDPNHFEEIIRRAILAGCVMASFTVEDFSFHRLQRLNKTELQTRGTSIIKMTTLKP